MMRIENECLSCDYCRDCGLYAVKRYYCDKCGGECNTEKMYSWGRWEDLCDECFEEVAVEDFRKEYRKEVEF